MLDRIFRGKIHTGSLLVRLPDGTEERYGEGAPYAEWHVHDSAVLRRIAVDPEFMLGQTYMDGAWSTPDLVCLLHVLLVNFPEERRPLWRRTADRLLQPLKQWNRRTASRRNVSHHYDIDESLFQRFLDTDLQYSCAYWPRPGMSLEAAQRAKKELIRRKLCLQPGQRVLDIGCGWGGLAIHLAEQAGARVTGLTLSRGQYERARERVRERGLEDRVEIRLQDYRENEECYDRVVSVGMFEHVGARFYDIFFRSMRERLTEQGAALLHTIGRVTPPGTTNPWIQRYIFPGGYIPALSETAAAIERQDLVCADLEVLRLHYAETLAAWQRRFQRIREAVCAEKNERFCRMWEFYLATSEAAFRWRGLVVFQFQLVRDQTAVPLTRDYLYAEAPPAADAERSRA